MQIITYLHNQNQFLTQISPQPTKTAENNIYMIIIQN